MVFRIASLIIPPSPRTDCSCHRHLAHHRSVRGEDVSDSNDDSSSDDTNDAEVNERRTTPVDLDKADAASNEAQSLELWQLAKGTHTPHLSHTGPPLSFSFWCSSNDDDMALAAIGQQAKMPSVLFHIPGITQDFLQQEMGPPGVHP